MNVKHSQVFIFRKKDKKLNNTKVESDAPLGFWALP